MRISDNTRMLLIEFCESHGVNSLYIFGSYARNEATSSSDMDLLVEFNEKLQLSYLDVLKLKLELELITGTHIDLLEQNALKNPVRRKRIMNERVLLYAS
ncbi:MAG: nucleotidyltransferase domain-containing protein [Candidatus Sabulitectum sp.]|nr:nucleotidyltransferase domain-containing protein [Candidatus Sabulitectum sp.]